MTGWRLVASLLFAFGAGCIVASWVALIRNEDTRLELYRRALNAGVDTDHEACNRYIDHQEGLLDMYKAVVEHQHPGDEAEEYLRDGGS